MLQSMRKAARSWVAGVLIGLLVISFAVWGINDVFRGPTRTGVAEVAGQEISPERFQQAFRAAVNELSNANQRQITETEAREAGVGGQVLERLVGEASIDALARHLGVAASRQVAAKEIQAIPAFRNPVTGAFDPQTYRQVLTQNQLTVEQFEANVLGELTRRKLVLAAGTGALTPPQYAALELAFRTERRGVSVVILDPGLVGAGAPPTEAQLKTFYDERRAQLMQPERRDLTLAVAEQAAFETQVVVSPQRLQELYEFRKPQLTRAATRSLVQIVAPDEAKARQAAARLSAGEEPEAVAKALQLAAPITLEGVRQDQIPDRAVADAVFRQAGPGVVGPVKGALAWAAVRVTAAAAESVPPLSAVEAQLRAEVVKEDGQAALLKATEAFEDAIQDGAALEAAARAAGMTIVKVMNVDAQGRTGDGAPAPTLAPHREALQAAFTQPQSDVGDMQPYGESGYAAIRVDAIRPAAPVPLAEVRPVLEAQWRIQDLERRLRARADQVAAQARTSTLAAAAQAIGRPVAGRPAPLLRGETDGVIGQALAQAIFAAKRGEVVVGPTAQPGGFVVARIDSVERDADGAVPARTEAMRRGMAQALGQTIVNTLERAARQRFEARTFPDRANVAIGGTAEGEGAAPAAPAQGGAN